MFERLINWAYQKQEAKRRQQKMQRIQSVLSKSFTLSRQTNFDDPEGVVEAFRQPKNKLQRGEVTVTVPQTQSSYDPIHPRGEIQKAIYHLGRLRKDFQNQADVWAEDNDYEAEMNTQADKVRDIIGTLKELESSMVSEADKRRELARAAVARDKARRAAGCKVIRRISEEPVNLYGKLESDEPDVETEEMPLSDILAELSDDPNSTA